MTSNMSDKSNCSESNFVFFTKMSLVERSFNQFRSCCYHIFWKFHGLFRRKICLIVFFVRDDKDAKPKQVFSEYFTFLLEKNVGKLVFKISTLKILEVDKDEIKTSIEFRTQYILLLREKGWNND